MLNIFIGILFVALACIFIVARKTYLKLPEKELKRRAASQNANYQDLYKAVAYGESLKALLWVCILLSLALGLAIISQKASLLVAIILVGALVFMSLVWLPNSRLSNFGQKIALIINPVIVWILGYLDPVIKKIATKTESWSHREFHTGLFEKKDLVDVIDKLQHQKDSRFTEEELEIAKRALNFDDHQIRDVMTPRKRIKIISPDALIGPVLIDELHKNGQQYALVQASAKGPIEGFVDYTKLDLQRSGKIKDFMERTIYYVNQEDKLSEALRAFKITNHPLLVVVNSHEDFVGVLNVDSILAELLGHIPGDDFDQYADLSAVANKHLKIHHADEQETSVKTEE